MTTTVQPPVQRVEPVISADGRRITMHPGAVVGGVAVDCPTCLVSDGRVVWGGYGSAAHDQHVTYLVCAYGHRYATHVGFDVVAGRVVFYVNAAPWWAPDTMLTGWWGW